jgi:hypothetical protein
MDSTIQCTTIDDETMKKWVDFWKLNSIQMKILNDITCYLN